MSVQKKLAKLTPGTPSLEPGVGGIPELTGQDVAAALGYAHGRVPNDRMGIHLVLAKYTDDNISIHVLQKTVARLAWVTWFDLGLSGTISRSSITKLSKMALMDYCEAGLFTKADAGDIAKMVMVNDYDWRNKHSKVYTALMQLFSELENPVLRIVYEALAR